MKKTHTFSRYIFMVLLVLESLTLVVVVGVLHAMLVKSMDREYQNEVSMQVTEFRFYLKDRHEHALARLDEISANSSIKVALLLGMWDKVDEVVTTLYPAANGVTYYIRDPSNALLPPPVEVHDFLNTMVLDDRADMHGAVPHTRPTMHVFSRLIVRRGKLLGRAIGVYDLSADRNWSDIFETFKRYRLLQETSEGLVDVKDGTVHPLTSVQKNRLQTDATMLRMPHMLVIPLKDYASMYLAADTQPLDAKKRKLLTNILLLCVPLLGLALWASFMILKKVTSSLNALADDARKITQGGFDHYLDESKIKHVEFLDLTEALNNALTQINSRNKQLSQLNRSLKEEISERKQLGDALAKREMQLRSLQDNIPIGLFRTTPKGKVRYANPAFLDIFGYQSIAELQAAGVQRLFEDEAERQLALDHLSEAGIIKGMQIRMRRKDGSIFWALVHVKRADDAQNEEIYLDGSIQDIDAQIKAEKDKRRLESQLQQAQKMETIGTLAGGIAHDFNNILASITGYTELALEDSSADSIQEDNLNCVLISARRAADLVGQILTFARQTDTEKKSIQIFLALREAIRLLRSTLPSTIKLKEEIKSKSFVLAAPTQIHQVVVNLCSNAGHAMQASGGMLTIGLSDVDLDATHVDSNGLAKAGPHVKLSISDTGHGIAPEIMDRIYDPYFTTKKQGEGTGIGLSVVQGIVRTHGGFLRVESQPGRGTTFEVYLPIVKGRNAPRHKKILDVTGGDERILWVDDEKPILRMGQQLLARLGYTVTSCSDSLEALEQFKNAPHDYDVVITDMTMPDLTGDLLAEKITAIRPQVPVILCTGYSKNLDYDKVARSGVRAVLHKPLGKVTLAQTIRDVLENDAPAEVESSRHRSLT